MGKIVALHAVDQGLVDSLCELVRAFYYATDPNALDLNLDDAQERLLEMIVT